MRAWTYTKVPFLLFVLSIYLSFHRSLFSFEVCKSDRREVENENASLQKRKNKKRNKPPPQKNIRSFLVKKNTKRYKAEKEPPLTMQKMSEEKAALPLKKTRWQTCSRRDHSMLDVGSMQQPWSQRSESHNRRRSLGACCYDKKRDRKELLAPNPWWSAHANICNDEWKGVIQKETRGCITISTMHKAKMIK